MVTDGARKGILLEFTALSRSLGADLLHYGDTPPGGFSSVCVDSRAATAGGLFVALPGSACDGHAFVEAAFKNGAAAALVERAKIGEYGLAALAKKPGKTLIAVDNTLRALQNTAAVYLARFPRLIKIGITGSSGKTTTKEIAASIIGLEKNTVMNPGNYNSETGLPLSVFAVRPCHEAGIFEMGMNRRGEIAELAAVLKPDLALITNVGTAHIGIIGSAEAIAQEKKNIFSQFDGKGIALIPEASPFRDTLGDGVRGRVSLYGEQSLPEFGGARNLGLDGSEITWAGQRIRFPLPGRHNVANALAALALAKEISISADAVRQGLESARPLFGRGEIFRGNITVIQDCYNANPDSVERALEFCDSLDWPGRRVYVIGDMLELGGKSREAHERLGGILLASQADMIFLYGKETAVTAAVLRDNAADCFHNGDMDELSLALGAYVKRGDLVLLKGSRNCALERLSALFVNETGMRTEGAA